MTAVSTLMTRERLVTIGPDAWVVDAAKAIAASGISHLLVTGEDQRLLGLFCLCDLDRAPNGARLRQHMHVDPVTIGIDTEAEVALEIMESRGISCLPVLDAGRLMGVITLHDLRRLGFLDTEAERCSACGSTEHVRCPHNSGLGLCIDCTRKSEPPDADAELGVGD